MGSADGGRRVFARLASCESKNGSGAGSAGFSVTGEPANRSYGGVPTMDFCGGDGGGGERGSAKGSSGDVGREDGLSSRLLSEAVGDGERRLCMYGYVWRDSEGGMTAMVLMVVQELSEKSTPGTLDTRMTLSSLSGACGSTGDVDLSCP